MSSQLIEKYENLLNEEKWTRATINNYTVKNFEELNDLITQFYDNHIQSEILLLTEEYLKRNAKISFDEFTKKFVENKIKLREIPGLKPYFRLKPPKKGFERYGIKMPYSMGGALGYRKENINDLVKRMI